MIIPETLKKNIRLSLSVIAVVITVQIKHLIILETIKK